MAVYRPPKKCTYCGHSNHFLYNPSPPGWVGDSGGKYPTICINCGKPINGKFFDTQKQVAMTKEAYKIRIDYNSDKVRIMEGDRSDIDYVDLEFSRLITALKECGYQIKEPSSLLYYQVK